ncbi:hypothetical protein TetV_124 [Tetraselmis virus 1]|uniref:Uncharacterized protein n=1 Tax=Tetraselmis virus 1 TaxID=2060617 RepID=A0A2P0VMU8_9VIRU|nr:hypothetical protein QJ968_gp124 [Tetraselmis virus 1]AUF82216.1 hypothetical protein TetV_124 [Tetraselmis virus 1]
MGQNQSSTTGDAVFDEAEKNLKDLGSDINYMKNQLVDVQNKLAECEAKKAESGIKQNVVEPAMVVAQEPEPDVVPEKEDVSEIEAVSEIEVEPETKTAEEEEETLIEPEVSDGTVATTEETKNDTTQATTGGAKGNLYGRRELSHGGTVATYGMGPIVSGILFVVISSLVQ